MIEAIAICRVSTPEQRLNNSLSRQEESVQKAASELGATIVERWAGSASSKVGKNVNRKDLNQAFDYCKSHRKVKYLIVDEVDRFMRSTAEMFYWMVKFGDIGVTVHFAANPELNGNDAKARLLLSLDAFKAEGSNEERQHKSIVGHEKAIREGRYTFRPKAGYTKGDLPGVHKPHPITFEPMHRALADMLSGVSTPLQALKALNDSRFKEVHAEWRMDKFSRFATDPYYAGIVHKDKQVKARNEAGQHTPMITIDEHEALVAIFNGRTKPRGPKKQYNPDFPLNKLLLCEDCSLEAKFTGSKKNNGYAKKKTRYYYKYHCRGCGNSYHRSDVHDALTGHLHKITYEDVQRKDFILALCTVWESKRRDKIQTINAYHKRIEELESIKSGLVRKMATADAEYEADLKVELEKLKQEIAHYKSLAQEADTLTEDLIDFVQYALQYTDELAADWWKLDYEDRLRCQQLLFPAGISFNSQKKVGTPEISPIYSLRANKKDLRIDRKSLMVELAGTAPASAGLSWLAVYRFRSFQIYRNILVNDQKAYSGRSGLSSHHEP